MVLVREQDADVHDAVPLLSSSSGQTHRSTRWLRLCLVACYSITFFIFGLEVNLFGPTIPDLAERLGIREADLGPIFTITGLSSTLGAIPSGWLVDRYPGHVLLILSLLFQGAGFLLIPYCTTLWSLGCVFAVVSFTYNIINTAGNTLTLWLYHGHNTTTVINVINTLFGAGSLAAPLLAERVTAGVGSAIPSYWVITGFCGLGALVLLPLQSPSNPHQEHSRATATPRHGSSRRSSDLTAITVVALLILINVGSEVCYGGWVTTYALHKEGVTLRQAELAAAVYWGAFTLGRLVASFASTCLGPATLLWLSLPLLMVGSVPLIVAPHALHPWGLWASAVLVGLGASTGFANALALLDSMVPVTGMITGVLGGVAGTGCMLLPLSVSLLARYQSLGFTSLMWVMALSGVVQVLLLVVVLLVGRGRRRRKQAGILERVQEEAAVSSGADEPLLDEEVPVACNHHQTG